MSSNNKLTDELIKGRFYYYHTTSTVKAYEYFMRGQWRSRKGYYGLGLYGYAYPPNQYASTYGDIVFRCQVLRFHRIFFASVDLGQQAFTGYSASMGLNILDEPAGPDKYVKGAFRKLGLKGVLEGGDINDSVLYTDDSSKKCFLNDFDFDGMAYRSHDGYAIVLWNFSPQLLRITGVKRKRDRDFKDIPVGASQQEVEDILNGVVAQKKSTAAPKQAAPSASSATRPLLPPSVLKYMDKPYLQAHLKKAVDLGSMYTSSPSYTLSVLDTVFIESWYIRFNLTHRKKIYSWVSDDVYTDIILAAYAVAYACTDRVVPVDISLISDVIDINRLLKYLLPFSIKNKYNFGAWTSAFGFVDFSFEARVVLLWHSYSSEVTIGRFLVGSEWTKETYNFDVIGKYFDLFKSELEAYLKKSGISHNFDYYFDLIKSRPTDYFSVWSTSGNASLGSVESVSSAGIVYR